jgi:MSHA biogenesis protein MshP
MKPPMQMQQQQQRGFGVIASIIVLVVLAALAAAIVRFGAVAQSTSAQAVLAARALQAARAGTEWGLYQAFKGSWTACSSASQTLDLATDLGFHVTVSCDSRSYNEGETAPGTARAVRLYTIDAVACNATTCPDNTRATTPGYVERRRQVQATD